MTHGELNTRLRASSLSLRSVGQIDWALGLPPARGRTAHRSTCLGVRGSQRRSSSRERSDTQRCWPTPRRTVRTMRMEVDTRPVGPGDLNDLAILFGAQRNTRHCWCTAFCVSGGQFAAGWFAGGNRRRFERMAAASATPVGVLAFVDGSPVGWGACGPRARYTAAIEGRSSLLRGRRRDEDHSVWLLACLFVASAYRGRGVTRALVGAAVDLARQEGALAIEGWPQAASASPSGDAFVGREEVFQAAGFGCVDRPTPQRAVMRLELRRGALQP